MMYEVGTPVVCVDGGFTLLRAQCPPALVTPTEGEVYHVRRAVLTERGLGLLLQEIDNQHVAPHHPEASFAVRRFRVAEEVSLTQVEELELEAA